MLLIKNAFPVMITLLLGLIMVFTEGAERFYGSALSEDTVIQNTESQSDALSENTDSESNVLSENDASGENTSSKSESSNQSGAESVEASADSQAAGKIIEQFISPYSAKYSYNNVYMKNTSGINIDLKSELEAKLSFRIKKTAEPEVLIVHTHATECYMEEKREYYTSGDAFRTTDNSKNITHIGEIVAKKLTEAGIGVIHDRTQHDYPSYTGSYSRSEKTIKEYLAQYPSIKIVLDIHRDSITVNENDRTRPVAEINGKRAAQVMLLMGSESGNVKNFPNWKENFRLGVKFQQTMEVMYPGLARPMVLASKLYNQNLTTGSMLLEVGTESNLKGEAEYTAELVGNALVSLINTLG